MIPGHIKEILENHGLIAHESEEGSTPTAETAAARLGVRVGQIAKSLLFKGKDGRFFLVVCAGDRRIDAKKLKALTGVSTRMANAEELKVQTGFSPGEVCPFGVTGPEVFLDTSLREYAVVYPAAGTDSSGVPATYEELEEITGAAPCDVCR